MGLISWKMADDNTGIADYLINYMAQLIQRPEVNPEVALVLRGTTGVGKDTYAEIITKLIGLDFVHNTEDISEAFPKTDDGGFNSVMKNKLLLVFNETSGQDTSKIKEQIKGQITRKYTNIKEKYLNPTKQKNHSRLVFLSNGNSPLIIEWNDRGRFFLLKVGSKFKGKTEYWNKLYKNINNQNKMNELLTYLLHRDISDFVPANPPYSKAYAIATSVSVPTHVRYLREMLFDEDADNYDFHQHPKKDIWFIKAKALYRSYDKFGTDHHLFEKGKFRGTYLKKALLEFESISWDKSCRQNGHINKYVVFNREILREELKKYRFTVNEKEDTDILDLDE